MSASDVVAISGRKKTSIIVQDSLTDVSQFAEVADLAVDNVARSPAPFAGYESIPPPAPKLQSRGIIAMDITQQFTHAAQGQCA